MNTFTGIRPGVAIPTEFDGVTYRSRLEANVAQFLKDMNIRFEYETKSFLLDGVHYCPDFYLPDCDGFVEARGYRSDEGEAQLTSFARQIRPIYVFYFEEAVEIRLSPDGSIIRFPLWISLCDFPHPGLGTLGLHSGDSPNCWYCRKIGAERHASVFMDIAMRGGVPVLVCEAPSNV